MLTHRTNLLLTPEEYTNLKTISGKKRQTIGSLIRYAITKTYMSTKLKQRNERAAVLNKLRKLGAKVNTKGINYKKLVEMGRKI